MILYCKCYLEVMWLSDLCTADGEQLLVGHYEGIRSFRSSSSKSEEILQDRPCESSWVLRRSQPQEHQLREANIHWSSGKYASSRWECIQLVYILKKHDHSLCIIEYRSRTQCIPKLGGNINHSDVSLVVSETVPSDAISPPATFCISLYWSLNIN